MSETVTERVRAAIQFEIQNRGLTQRRVGQIIGKSQAAAWRRMTGETPFDLAEIEALAQALEIPLASLLDVEERAS